MFDRKDKVLIAVSGGKDRLSLWDILDRLGYQTKGIYIKLGIDEENYSDESLNRVKAFAAQRAG